MADTPRSSTCTMFYETKTWQFAQDQVHTDRDETTNFEEIIGRAQTLAYIQATH